jgi:hypothetical protein
MRTGGAIIYLTYYVLSAKGHSVPRERDASAFGVRYFLAAFLGFVVFFFGVNGFGGVFNIRRSTSSSLGFDLSSFMAGV